MGENTAIEWADHTFNPWIGCSKVSPACQNCYAEALADTRMKMAAWGPEGTRVVTGSANWNIPKKLNTKAEYQGVRARVFVASLADIFEDWQYEMRDMRGLIIHQCEAGHFSCTDSISRTGRPCGEMCDRLAKPITMDNVRERLFNLIHDTPHLDWLILTKRPENVRGMWHSLILKDSNGKKYGKRHFPNIWLGTSIENQEWADKRLPFLHDAKSYGLCAKTFVSAEPLLGPLKLKDQLGGHGIDWVIAGGESGCYARPGDPAWFRSLRDQCHAAGIAFLFKQWGEYDADQNKVGKKLAGRSLDGRTHDEYPKARI